MAVNPRSVNFGRIKRGAESSIKYISLTGMDKNITKITSITSGNEYIKAETNLSVLEEDNKNQISITVLPGMKMGRFIEKVTINTDHEKLKELSFYVRGEIVGNIYVYPDHLYFSELKNNRMIRLKALFDTTFKVLDAKSTTLDLVTHIITKREGKEYWIRVRPTKDFDFKDGFLKGEINIRTDDKEGQDIINVGITGRYGGRVWKKRTERESEKAAEKK